MCEAIHAGLYGSDRRVQTVRRRLGRTPRSVSTGVRFGERLVLSLVQAGLRFAESLVEPAPLGHRGPQQLFRTINVLGVENQIGHGGKGLCSVAGAEDRKSTRLNSSHGYISYAVFCLKKKQK